MRVAILATYEITMSGPGKLAAHTVLLPLLPRQLTSLDPPATVYHQPLRLAYSQFFP